MPSDDHALRPATAAPEFRAASIADVDEIARLHADSWRRHYRGAYLDSFLDGDVVTDRQAVWAERFVHPRSDQYTIVAELAGVIVGFIHVVPDRDPTWGALVDNLHVTAVHKRHGIGTLLLAEAARCLEPRRPHGGGCYLWVLDQNKAAQAFYAARGGTRVETRLRGPFPGGGTARGHRIAWTNPTQLITQYA